MSAAPVPVPVAVAGAGFVGAALALGLARAGIAVTVVERQPARAAPREDGRGLALAMSSVSLLERLGVWTALAPQVCAVRHVHVTQRGHFGALRLSHHDVGQPALGYVCPAEALQEALLRALADAGVDVRFSHEIAALHVDADAAHLTLRTSEGSAGCTAALVIGADGADSAVRTLAGIGVRRHDYDQSAIVANVDVIDPRPNTALERFTVDGPLALLPLGGRRHVLVRAARRADVPGLLALPDRDYLAETARRFGVAAGYFTALGVRREHPLALQRAVALTAARVLLVGNAANTLHPNGAQGLNLGFRDAGCALDLLIDACTRGRDPGDLDLLRRYAAARHADHRATACITDTLARAFAVAHPLAGALRACALAGADRLPVMKRLALRRLALGASAFA
ncbi:MAG: FAD-dependent monooxygenase [Gammaproteobacteria bacterium]